MKKQLIIVAVIASLATALSAMTPYEKAKMEMQQSKMHNMDTSGTLQEVKNRYLQKIAKKKRTAPSMMRSKISGIENCINNATSVDGVKNCIPSMMK